MATTKPEAKPFDPYTAEDRKLRQALDAEWESLTSAGLDRDQHIHREIALRERMAAEWYPREMQARNRAYTDAIRRLDIARLEVANRLENIGFVRVDLGSREREWGLLHGIKTFLIEAHPLVGEAAVDVSNGLVAINDRSDQQANLQTIVDLNGELNAMQASGEIARLKLKRELATERAEQQRQIDELRKAQEVEVGGLRGQLASLTSMVKQAVGVGAKK